MLSAWQVILDRQAERAQRSLRSRLNREVPRLVDGTLMDEQGTRWNVYVHSNVEEPGGDPLHTVMLFSEEDARCYASDCDAGVAEWLRRFATSPTIRTESRRLA